MAQQLKNPSDSFVKYILSEIYPKARTQAVIDRFRDNIKKSLNQFVNELMNDKITTALKTSNDNAEGPSDATTEVKKPENEAPKIITTQDELEGYFIVKHILTDIVPREKIVHRDTESYFGILYENNKLK